MTGSTLRSLMLAALLVSVEPVLAQAGSECDVSLVFNLNEVSAACPSSSSDLDITLRWSDALRSDPDLLKHTQDRLRPRLAESKVIVEDLRGTGAGPRILAASIKDSVSLPASAKIAAPREPGKTYRSVSVVLAPNSLMCGDTLNSDEITIPLELREDGVNSTKLSCGGGANEAVQRKSLGWRIDLSPIDSSDGGSSEAAIDFNLDKTWGYNFKTGDDYLSWSENTWKLNLDGALSTDKNTFYNLLKGEIVWSYKKYKLGKDATGSLFPVYWLSAHLGPETTYDLDNRDLVYGARADAFLNTGGIARALIPGMQSTASIRPFVSFGVEAVDPDKRDDGTVPDNYERLTGKFWWKLPVTKRVYFEAKWEALYILDDKDAGHLMVDQFTDRLDLGVSLAIGDSDEFRPFFKWSKGQKGPVFRDVEEYLIGILWELGGASSERQ